MNGSGSLDQPVEHAAAIHDQRSLNLEGSFRHDMHSGLEIPDKFPIPESFFPRHI